MFSNKIYKIDKNGKKRRVFWIRGLNVKFHGKNAEVIIHEPCVRFRNTTLECTDNAKVIFKPSKTKLRQMYISAMSKNGTIEIGRNLLPNTNCKILNYREPDLNIKIGDDCMMGPNVVIQSSDAHPIFEIDAKKIINKGADIEIADNVWMTTNVMVMKGVKIAKGCIIGANSIVSKDCPEENSIYAGTPCKLIKSGCTWTHEFF